MRLHLFALTTLVTALFADAVVGICCISASGGKDPCGAVAYALKIKSEVTPELGCCCEADNDLACRSRCVSRGLIVPRDVS
jgi:hypothetical protein